MPISDKNVYDMMLYKQTDTELSIVCHRSASKECVAVLFFRLT